ncbi:MAG: hypothetical protein IJN61_07330 [Clostridia bacterium]|nr:hypothetical protein [Clostridia bacterium]
MRADITNIPISEVFDPKEGCPICRMRNMLEQRMAEYITGAAMMEPDVRIETNRLGFCYDHFRMILKQRNRLGVALILESHLDEMEKTIFKGGLPLLGASTKAQAKKATARTKTCFICNQVDWAMERMLATVCRLWESEREFRQLFEEQEALCLPHFTELVSAAQKNMNKRSVGDFSKAASKLSKQYLESLRGDVSHFCKMFDYRNSGEGADWGNSRDSVERAVWFLTSREP